MECAPLRLILTYQCNSICLAALLELCKAVYRFLHIILEILAGAVDSLYLSDGESFLRPFLKRRGIYRLWADIDIELSGHHDQQSRAMTSS